jgi:hypothetical protein
LVVLAVLLTASAAFAQAQAPAAPAQASPEVAAASKAIDAANETGAFEWTLQPKGGAAVKDKGKFVAELRAALGDAAARTAHRNIGAPRRTATAVSGC